MSENKWQIGPVKLVNGEDAFIDAINEGQEHFRYTGRMPLQEALVAVGWDAQGRLMYAISGSPHNLSHPPKKKVRVQCWLMAWQAGGVTVFYHKKEVVDATKKHGFALIEIDRELEEGEGL